MAVIHFKPKGEPRYSLCGVSHFMNMTMTEILGDVTCKRCLKKLSKMTPEEICNICAYKSKVNCKNCNNAAVDCDQP
jgi:hypothetical protein